VQREPAQLAASTRDAAECCAHLKGVPEHRPACLGSQSRSTCSEMLFSGRRLLLRLPRPSASALPLTAPLTTFPSARWEERGLPDDRSILCLALSRR
jgi:hypothetical protein